MTCISSRNACFLGFTIHFYGGGGGGGGFRAGDFKPKMPLNCFCCDNVVRTLKNVNKEGNVLFNDALKTFYFTVLCRRVYKGPLI